MKRFLPLLLLVLLFTGDLFADGVVIPRTAFPAEISIPDQRALIHFTNGVERLVIETRFTGEGTNFCWVVPTPSEPKIEEATTGLFPTLEFLLQPELVHRRTALFPWLSVLFILIYLLAVLSPKRTPKIRHLILPLIVAIALAFYSGPAAFVAFTFLAWAFHRIHLGQVTLLTVFVFLFFIAVLSAMLLPALSGAGMLVSTTGNVREIQRKPRRLF